MRDLPINHPCTESWDEMRGGAMQRYCDKCERDVWNLSAMTRRAAQPLLERRAAGERVCVRYSTDDAGRIEFRSELLIPAALLTRGRQLALGAGLLAATLNGCMPAGTAVGSAAAQQVVDELGDVGTCSVSLEPVLPLSVQFHSSACAKKPAILGALEEVPPPPPAPPPPTETPPAPPPPVDGPVSAAASGETPPAKPARAPHTRASKAKQKQVEASSKRNLLLGW